MLVTKILGISRDLGHNKYKMLPWKILGPKYDEGASPYAHLPLSNRARL